MGNAVVRNRIKRRLREVVRAVLPRLQTGYDLVLIARPTLAAASISDLGATLAVLVTRARLWRPSATGGTQGGESSPGDESVRHTETA